MRFSFVPVVLFSSLSLIACGGGDDDGDSVDPLDPIDASTDNTPDSSTPAACSVSTANFGDKGALTGGAQFSGDPANPTSYLLGASALLETAAPADVLSVEFYTGFAPFGTPEAPTAVVPGTYQLTGEQLNYATCGVCARVATNLMEDGTFEHDYMATGGTVTVSEVGDAVGETLTFAVSNLTFEHVTINEETFESAPVGDNCTTAITGATFTATVEAAAMKRGQKVVLTRSR